MKKVISLVIMVALVAAMILTSIPAVFAEAGDVHTDLIKVDTAEYVGMPTNEAGAITGFYDMEAQPPIVFGSPYAELCQAVSFDYACVKVQLPITAYVTNIGDFTLNVYAYNEDVIESVDGEVVASVTTAVSFSNENYFVFDEPLPAGKYVFQFTGAPGLLDEGDFSVIPMLGHSLDPDNREIYQMECLGYSGYVDDENADWVLGFSMYLDSTKPAPTPDPDATEAPTATPEVTEAPTTEAPTEEATEAPTEVPTKAPADEKAEEGGCGSIIAGGAAMVALMGLAVVTMRKRR